MPCLRRTPVIALTLAAGLVCATGHAGPTDEPLREARQTFVQAEADEDAGRWSDALQRLSAVSRIKDTAGVRYHIALCEEHLGRMAQALADYQSASSQAALDKTQDVLRLVGRQLATLEPRVPRLTIHLLPDVPDASVKVDGLAARVGEAMRLDPGHHTVAVVASGKTPEAADVTLREYESTVLDVTLTSAPASAGPVPASPAPVSPVSAGPAPVSPAPVSPASAGPAPASPAPVSPAPVSPASTPTSRSGGHGLAVVASLLTAALAAGGAAAYAMAGAEHDRSVPLCATDVSTKPDACDALKSRVRTWDFGAGGLWAAALGAGAVSVALWTTDTHSPGSARAAVILRPDAITITGRF
jgi:hypothetical protein